MKSTDIITQRVFLQLGREYNFRWPFSPHWKRRVKFIQVTPKGYNFLDLETNKCILRKHLYIANKLDSWDSKNNGCWFFVRSKRGLFLNP